MERFKRIGIILDLAQDNKKAIAHAQALAATNEAELYVICAEKYAFDDHNQQSIKNVLAESIEYPFTTVFLTGIPLLKIVEYIDQQELDMIIKEPDNTSGLVRFFYGSMTMSLLRKAPCPVWVVKKAPNQSYSRVMIAVDPLTEDKIEQKLNDKLVEMGASFAQRQQAECHLVTAWHLSSERTLLNSGFLTTSHEEIDALKMERKQASAEAFERLQQRHQSQLEGCRTHLLNGAPERVIPQFAQEQGIDIVFMGTLARSGVRGFVMGNTAEHIINQLECSLIAVKPEDFVSPLLM